MDSLITAAARALAFGDPVGALQRIALREDPAALALRGTAMAQLGELARARELLRRAARGYGPREALARARCTVAEIEVALAARDLGWPARRLAGAREVLEAHGDRANAAHAGYLEMRRQVLLGRLSAAEQALAGIDPLALPPPLQAAHELVVAGIALRRVRAVAARAALARAGRAAQAAGIPALAAEVDALAQALAAPAARLHGAGAVRLLRLDEVERVLGSRALVIDACRLQVRQADAVIPLAGRPLLFTLVRQLALAWPADVAREELIAQAFRTRRPDDSHRARLRVELGRLRRLLRPLADVQATRQGFVLVPRDAPEVAVLAPPLDQPHGSVLALLADGEAWSSSALALALGVSARTVQRALEALAAAGKVQASGRGRACRWMMPAWPGFATALLLPLPLADG